MAEGGSDWVWYDLMTTDPAAAAKFYTDVIGWGTQEWDGPMPYTMFTLGGIPIGGVADLPAEAKAAGAPPNWMAYIGVADTDATAKQASELGGRVLVEPTDIPTVGRFAVLQDPQGAVFACFTPGGEPMPQPPQGAGLFSWHELATTDHNAALEFYSKLAGWTKHDVHDMGEMGEYVIYGNAADLGGMFHKPVEMPGPPMWIYYVTVDGLDDVCEAVKTSGGQVVNGPMDVPGGDRIAHCMDPQGAMFALHEKNQAT